MYETVGIEDAKKIAGFVTRTNDEDGMAYAIDKFVLKMNMSDDSIDRLWNVENLYTRGLRRR